MDSDGATPTVSGGSANDTTSDTANGTTNGELPGMEVVVEVSATERTLVRLSDGDVFMAADDGQSSEDWDLAFQGWDIFTNSGPSGPGQGLSFGPFDELNFLFGDEPMVPFLRSDRTGGVFEGWYAYDGEGPVLHSRYFVYGVRQAERLWKVQLLSYYGDLLNDAGEVSASGVSAIYQLRFAEVTEDGLGDLQTVSINGTAGGPKGTDESPSGCIDLDSGQEVLLPPAEARDTDGWHICFRRDTISVNGGAGGPGGVEAARVVTDERTVTQLRDTTPEDELPEFETVDYDALTSSDVEYFGDHVVSSFSNLWFAGQEPAEGAWLVVAADGVTKYLMIFKTVAGATVDSPGTLTLQVRPLEEMQ